MSMAYRLKSMDKPFKFYYRARKRSWAAYVDLLEKEFGDSVVCLFSDEGGREKFDLDAILSAVPAGTHLYTCGANGFMETVVEAAKRYLPEDNIHLEHFYPPEPDESVVSREFELHCAKSGLTLKVPADKSIVQVLEENGVDIPVSCTDGICGSCIFCFQGWSSVYGGY
jgi:vanillate O-demethylase ferredoxin subunit